MRPPAPMGHPTEGHGYEHALDSRTMRTYVRAMGLVWRETSTNRWVGTDDDGQQIGHVGLVVSQGGAKRSWHGWRRDGTPAGIDVRHFATAEAAMAVVNEAG